MIRISRICDGKRFAAEIEACRTRGMRTNCYADAAEWLPLIEAGDAYHAAFDGGFYCFAEREKQVDLTFFLEKDALPPPLPQGLPQKPLLLEQVAAARLPLSPPLAAWEAIGFRPYVQRKRLYLPAKNVPAEERKLNFADAGMTDEIFAAMQQAFEPYTSALPTRETLAADIAAGRVLVAAEGGRLCGALRFGREKKTTVLRQIVIFPQARGYGVGGRLVRDWLAAERESVSKFQLWVREDNAPACAMYEKRGFLPDGRIAPVLIKTQSPRRKRKENGHGNITENFGGTETGCGF